MNKGPLLLILILFWSISGYAQAKRINILQSDVTFANPQYPDATVSQGNVFIEHDGVTLRCDKAYIFQKTKIIKALGNVVMNQGDSVFQYSKYADYDGNQRKATSWGDVVLKDQFMTLKTDTLYFDRENQHLFYKTGGTIKDTTNFLKSTIGNYYLREHKFQAINQVNVTNEDSELDSNHLDYYTNSGISYIYGPSTITSENNVIYSERGMHNSKTNISHFVKNAKITYGDQIIHGDSIYYDKNIEFASATGNIKLLDTINNTLVKGGYAEFFKQKDSAFIIDRAVAISKVENDSIYIHGDKLLVTGAVEDRILRAFKRVKVFKADLQAKCDSLVTYESTGLTKLITNPVMWAEGNQITGDTIHLISNPKTEQLDSLKILNNAFMIQKDDAGFSQLKGKNMYGTFENNALKTLDVIGNSEVIFYIRDENNILLGIEKMKTSKNIFFTFDEGQIELIYYNKQPDGQTYPPSEFDKLNPNDQRLKGFIWREEERPLKKEDIFIKDADDDGATAGQTDEE